MCSPSTVAKFNCLVIRYLYFRSVRGDLQEGHVYDKRLCGYASLMPIPRLLEHKIGFFVLGKSNRGKGVRRKGRVIAERAKGRRNLRDAYGAQYSKKIIFLLFIPFI